MSEDPAGEVRREKITIVPSLNVRAADDTNYNDDEENDEEEEEIITDIIEKNERDDEDKFLSQAYDIVEFIREYYPGLCVSSTSVTSLFSLISEENGFSS